MRRRNREFYYGSFVIVLADHAPMHAVPLAEEGVSVNGNRVKIDQGAFQSMMGVLQFYSSHNTPFFLRCDFVHHILGDDANLLWKNHNIPHQSTNVSVTPG